MTEPGSRLPADSPREPLQPPEGMGEEPKHETSGHVDGERDFNEPTPLIELIPDIDLTKLLSKEQLDAIYEQSRKNDRGVTDIGRPQGDTQYMDWLMRKLELIYPEAMDVLRKRFIGKIIVDLGIGESTHGYRLANSFGAKAYIGVDLFHAHLAGSFIAQAPPGENKIPWSVIQDDALAVLKALPDGSASVWMGGINAEVIPRKHLDQIIREIERVLGTDDAFLSAHSDVWYSTSGNPNSKLKEEPLFAASTPTEHGSLFVKETKFYNTIDGIRFEETIPEVLVQSIVAKMKEAEDQLRSSDTRNDPRCFLEHALVGGTAYPISDPLKPFSLFTKSKTFQETSSARSKHASYNTGLYRLDGSSDSDFENEFFLRKVCEGKGWTQCLVEYGDIQVTKFGYTEDIERISMPAITGIASPEKMHVSKFVDSSHILMHKPRLRQQRILISSHNLFSEEDGIVAYIDKKGWRFEKVEK